jgi:hypothetical protein
MLNKITTPANLYSLGFKPSFLFISVVIHLYKILKTAHQVILNIHSLIPEIATLLGYTMCLYAFSLYFRRPFRATKST